MRKLKGYKGIGMRKIKRIPGDWDEKDEKDTSGSRRER